MRKKIIYISSLFFVLLLACNLNRGLTSAKYIDKKQDSLAFVLCEIYGLDQGIRNPELKFSELQLIQKIDTINFYKIIKFIEKNGFPRKELLGETNIRNECVESCVTSVLLHNPHRLVNENEYYELFLKEVKKGTLKATTFATILDKYYWTISKNKQNRRVFYGSQFGKPCIQTKEATNKARIEIGLPILNDDEFVDCTNEILEMPKKRK